jgi:mannose-6-phosphate isomerase-like protein (cupin superfamily)
MTVNQELNLKKDTGKNFTAVHVGKFSALDQYELTMQSVNRTVHGKVFLREAIDSTSVQISLNKLPAGRAVPFYHAHKLNEEVYIFTGGKGQMQIDDQTFDVEEGTVVRIKTEGVRTWRNNSDQDLYYVVIQAKENSLTADTFEDGIKGENSVVWAD